MPSRRRYLAALGAAGAALAGCSYIRGPPSPDEPPEAGVENPPEPRSDLHGADGEWSSVGCNASNTRAVADGRAPVDGVTERWRAEVGGSAYREPVVADGRVYHCFTDLVAYDADDGDELWHHPDVETTPVVWDGTAYAGAEGRLLALDAETGDPKWELTLSDDESVGVPAMHAGQGLYVPAGETVYKIDPESNAIEWSRDAFGRILGPPAYLSQTGCAFATAAGKVYLLGHDGIGLGEWDVPSVPEAPLTADADALYVNCQDGKTYGIETRQPPRRDVDWHAETSRSSGGLAAKKFVYAAGANGLTAVDPEAGDTLWEYDTGNWRWTAPALGRDTLFVGGDRLYALDPTPGPGTPDEPAVRFERSFHGRVGPGPVLDDGTIYVVAETDERTFHLLALE